MSARRYLYDVTGERARELLFLYGQKGNFLVRPSESSPNDYTISIHRGTRVTHVKIPLDPAQNLYRLPNGQGHPSVDSVVKLLESQPNILSDCDGVAMDISVPVQMPIAETVVNVGKERYFHLSTTGREAESLLKDEPVGTYLVRESSSNEGEFAISVKNNDGFVLHVRIYFNKRRFSIVPKDSFRTLTDLLDNYIRIPMVQNDGSIVPLKTALPSTRFTAATIDYRIDSLLRSARKAGVKDGFVEEFESLHREEDAQMFISCKEGRRAENVRKNRYRNVVPFDHTRICLKVTTDGESDYINANIIEVPLDAHHYPEFGDLRRRYISTQGCLEETVHDFWKMVWQENVQKIVMVTKEVERGRVKCFRYWPDLSETHIFEGNPRLVVKNIQEQKCEDYIFRVFDLNEDNSEGDGHRIFHYQILGWEDNDACPVQSVLKFIDAVNSGPNKEELLLEEPTVVHCSAGIGRTGTYLALDILINQIKRKGPQCVCSVQKTVRLLREQRATMVQTEAQYRFIYYVISAFMKTYRASD